jgi:adenylate cyclase
LASRIESATRHLGPPILVAGSTRERLPPEFLLRRVCRARLSGVLEPVALFELPEQPPPSDWLEYCTTFEAALTQFEAADWSAAEKSLAKLAKTARGGRDPAIERLLGCARQFAGGPCKEIEPVLELKSK